MLSFDLVFDHAQAQNHQLMAYPLKFQTSRAARPILFPILLSTTLVETSRKGAIEVMSCLCHCGTD